jgi:imidazolonepropionase-like amidohydrolase
MKILATLALTGATLIDGTGRAPIPDAVVLIRDGRIAAAGPRSRVPIPQGAHVEDLKGKFLVPGFFDMHAHVTILFGTKDAQGYDPATSAAVLEKLLAFGITTVRNPSAPLPVGVELRDAVASGKLRGPRIFTTGESVNGRAFRSGPNGIVHTEEEARQEVRRQVAAGVDAIKLYSGLQPDLARAAIAEAHARKVRVVGHLGTTTWTEGAQAGIDGVEHGAPWTSDWLAPADREAYERAVDENGMKARILWLERLNLKGPEVTAAVDELARHHVTVDPTLIAYATKFEGDDPKYIASPDFALCPPALIADWKKGTFVSDWTADDFRRGHAAWPKVLQLAKLYYDRGVTLLTGSDLPNPWVIPGVSYHQELALLAEAGIPPLEILKMATHNGAEALGILAEVGTIEPGKQADLVVLQADPLADIHNTRRIEKVMQRGEWSR